MRGSTLPSENKPQAVFPQRPSNAGHAAQISARSQGGVLDAGALPSHRSGKLSETLYAPWLPWSTLYNYSP